MSLRDLDLLLKKYWEGMFKKSGGSLQPVEIARSLVREMGDRRRVSVSRVYAPNIFTVYLGSDDFDQTVPLQAALAQELEEHILVQAEEKGFSLIGKPQISFNSDQTLELGGIRIESSYKAIEEDAVRIAPGEETGTGRTSELQRISRTMIFDKSELDDREVTNLYLSVIQGPDIGKIFSLDSQQQCFTIGRKLTNDIYITDINASREHAQLVWRDAALFLKDLKSHNGTYVNNDKIEERQVGVGDLIQIGENLFQIEGSH